jgi:hypothetical protein
MKKMYLIGGMPIYVFDEESDRLIFDFVHRYNNFSENQKLFLQEEFILMMRDSLKETNKFCKDLNFIGNVVDNLNGENIDVNDRFKLIYDVRASLKNKVQYFDVASVTYDRYTGHKVLSISRQDGSVGYVNMDDPDVEPLTYTLIFQHGEKGYGSKDIANLPFNKYLASRLLRPEHLGYKNVDGNLVPIFLTAPHHSDFEEIDNDQVYRQLRTNRFQIFCRLGQVYVVDMVSRAIDKRLSYIIRNQDKFHMGQKWKSKYDMGDDDSDLDDEDEEDFNDDAFVNGEQRAKEIFLPSSFHGSPRHRKKLALNALSVVTEKGKPTLFITGTCNVNWPEIQSQLLKGQTAFDRPDVVMQVFRCRLAKFIHNLRHGKMDFIEFIRCKT